jgi:hypothetical protein
MLVRRGIFCGLGICAESGLIHWAAGFRGKPARQLTSVTSSLRKPVLCWVVQVYFAGPTCSLAWALCDLVEYHGQQDINQNR